MTDKIFPPCKRNKKEDDEIIKKMVIAADIGDRETVMELLKSGTNPNAPLLHHPQFNGAMAPLHVAARSGHLNICRLLVENGADVNVLSAENWTPLYYATNTGNTDIVEYFLARGADKTIRDSYHNRTPLDVAKYRQFHDIVKLLGGDPSDTSYHRTPEQIAAKEDVSGKRSHKRKGRADVMRGIHKRFKNLFLGRYRISEESIQNIIDHRQGKHETMIILAFDTVAEMDVEIHFANNRSVHLKAVSKIESSFIRSCAIETDDFIFIIKK